MTTLELVPANAPTDDAKPEQAFEYACEVCGAELTYGGRGRKPKYCAEHRKGNKSAGSIAKTTGQNKNVAAQAADIIVQWTDIMELMCTLFGFDETKDAINARQDILREQCYQALLTNPTRAKSIIRMGGGSSDAGLIIALGMFAAGVGSTAFNEAKEKRNAKREDE